MVYADVINTIDKAEIAQTSWVTVQAHGPFLNPFFSLIFYHQPLFHCQTSVIQG